MHTVTHTYTHKKTKTDILEQCPELDVFSLIFVCVCVWMFRWCWLWLRSVSNRLLACTLGLPHIFLFHIHTHTYSHMYIQIAKWAAPTTHISSWVPRFSKRGGRVCVCVPVYVWALGHCSFPLNFSSSLIPPTTATLTATSLDTLTHTHTQAQFCIQKHTKTYKAGRRRWCCCRGSAVVGVCMWVGGWGAGSHALILIKYLILSLSNFD